MNECLEQAKNFLNKANAKCEIVYGGIFCCSTLLFVFV